MIPRLSVTLPGVLVASSAFRPAAAAECIGELRAAATPPKQPILALKTAMSLAYKEALKRKGPVDRAAPKRKIAEIK